MTRTQPPLGLATSTLNSKLVSIRRKYTDTLRQYRAYQGALDHGHRAEYIISNVAYYRDTLRSLSYQHRAYKRAVAVLEAEQVPAPTGMTGPQLIEATDVVRGVMQNAHNIPQDQFAGQIAYQLSRRGFHK